MTNPSQPRSRKEAAQRLRVRTFGGLCITGVDGRSIHEAVSLRRPAAVVIAAAVSGDRGITRDKLLGLLWPETDPDRGRHSLTQAMYAIRRATGVDQLFVRNGQVLLNRSEVSTDVDDFNRCLDDGDLEHAVELYEGPFLDGFFVSDSAEFEQWVSAQRTRFADQVARALEELATQAAARRDHRHAVEWRRRLVAIRPLDSTVAAALVRALAKAGDRAGALHSALAHATALKEELDLEPDPALTAMIESLREPAPSAIQADLPAPDIAVALHPSINSIADSAPSPITPSRNARTIASFGRRAPTKVLVAACVGLLLLLSRQLLSRPSRSAASTTDHTPRVFVAPFDVSGASASLTYLGNGLARLLTPRLDGGDQRAIDAARALSAWRSAGLNGASEVPRDSIMKLAKGQGADRVVVGSVVGGAAHTVLFATALRIDGSVLATATVEGSADTISRLAVRLAAKLLVTQAGESPTLMEDTPFPALRAFLDGRLAYRRGDYAAASHAFQNAVRLDSTFALAGLQLARAADRLGELDEEDAALAHAWVYRARLDERDRAQLVALAGPNYPRPTGREAQVGAWSNAVRAAPDRAGYWYELGARLAHDGRRLGAESTSDQALAALNRALVLDPGYAPARELLAHLAMTSGEQVARGAMRSLSDSVSSLGPFLQWRYAVERGDSSALREFRSRVLSMSRESLRAIAMASQFDAVGLGDGELAIRALGERATSTAQRVDAVLAAHSLAMNLGQTTEAARQTTLLAELRPDSHAYLRLRLLDALYGGGDPVVAADAARQLGAPVDSLFREFPLMRSRVAADACVLAQWRLSQRDTSEVRAIVALLRDRDTRREYQPVSAAPRVCGDLVDASLAVAIGRPDALELVERLDSLVLTSAVAGNVSQYANIAVSRLYGALGYPRRSLATLRKRAYMAGWPAYLSATWREEWRLAMLTGDLPRATASRRRYAALRRASPASVGAQQQ